SYHVKSSLQNALDAAVTSTARDLTLGAIKTDDARKVVEAFLRANSDSKFSVQDGLVLDTLDIDPLTRTVSATAHANVALAFPIFTKKDPRVSIGSAALYSDRNIEVAMMLDVTGSMEGDKIEDLKDAASGAVERLLEKNLDPSNPRVRVAIVPYANSVNVGTQIAEKAVFVEATSNDRKQAPSSEDPKPVGASRPDNCATERKGHYRYRNDGPSASMVNRDYLLDAYAQERYTPQCPTNSVMVPLSADLTKLTDTIGSFVAEGGTAGHIGIQWTWYMLSSQWADVVGTAAAPAVKNPKRVGKYAILMTDGEFNLGYDGATSTKDVYGKKAKLRSMPHAKALCEAMRKDGIEVFTIGFDLKQEDAKDVMRSCATPDTSSFKHYYEAATGEQLKAAFDTIVANIEGLALTR
ncbi:MAG: hypothetical protein WBA88_20625, partial [Pseudaminobacter sp.]